MTVTYRFCQCHSRNQKPKTDAIIKCSNHNQKKDKTDEASFSIHDIIVRKLAEYVKNDIEKYGGLLVTEAELLDYALKFNGGEKAKISEVSPLVTKIALKKKPPKTEAQIAREREREAAKAKREAEKKMKEEMLEKWRKCQLSLNLNY